jgi:hypothetical protein
MQQRLQTHSHAARGGVRAMRENSFECMLSREFSIFSEKEKGKSFLCAIGKFSSEAAKSIFNFCGGEFSVGKFDVKGHQVQYSRLLKKLSVENPKHSLAV